MKASFLRIIVGLIVVVIGLVALASNIGVWSININDAWNTWWPLLVIGGGVVIFLNDFKSYSWALLVIAAGVVFQLHALDILQVNPWQVIWPLIIIAVGVSIAIEADRRSKVKVSAKDQDDVTAILGGSDKRYVSDDYKGTSVTAVMGGIKLDLSKVIIKDQAVVSVTAILGGVELLVPRNIVVQNEISSILGGVEDRTSQEVTKTSPKLIIVGEVVLGGVEIKN